MKKAKGADLVCTSKKKVSYQLTSKITTKYLTDSTYLFKRLLADGYDNEGAKDVILYNCLLSALVMQERLDNGYYLKIKADDVIAPDLLKLYLEHLIKQKLR